MTALGTCAWCNTDAVATSRVARSIAVPVCRRHLEMIQRNRAEKAAQEALERTRSELRARRRGTGAIR
ncbi:MAG: hypothetical protein ACJ768_09300 [Gaiellaceae bacterium]